MLCTPRMVEILLKEDDLDNSYTAVLVCVAATPNLCCKTAHHENPACWGFLDIHACKCHVCKCHVCMLSFIMFRSLLPSLTWTDCKSVSSKTVRTVLI